MCFAHLKRGDVTCASSSSSLHIQTYKIHKLTSKMKSAWYDASTKTPRNKLLFKSRIFIIFESFVAHMSHKPKQKGFIPKNSPDPRTRLISACSFPQLGWWICCSGMKLFRNWEYKRSSLHSVTIQEKESCINGVTEWKIPRQPVNLERHILGLKRTTGYVHTRTLDNFNEWV